MTSWQCFSDETAQKYQDLGYWEPLTLGEHLENWSETFGSRIALVEGDEKLTYEELNNKANQLCSGFLNLGIKKGDKVVVQLPNSIVFVLVSFALFKMGAIPIMAMPAHRESELDGIFKLAQPTAYIVEKNYLGFNYTDMAHRLCERHAGIKHLLINDAAQDFLKTNQSFSLQKPDLPKSTDMALLLLSGGTTGTPKLIPRTHADYA